MRRLRQMHPLDLRDQLEVIHARRVHNLVMSAVDHERRLRDPVRVVFCAPAPEWACAEDF